MIVTHSNLPVADYASIVGDDGQLIDVREPHEVAAGTLPDAINIPLGQLVQRMSELDPTKRVVVLCRSGARSTRACEQLSAAGFVDVVNLAGGMLAYRG